MPNLILKITFKKTSNQFQSKIKNDFQDIKNSKKSWIKAYKSKKQNNEIKPSDYNQLIPNKISNSQEKDKNNNTLSPINTDTAKFANKYNVANRVGTTHMKSDYLVFKDHKPSFVNNLQSRLINPSKSESGLISKNILKKK